MTIVDLPLVVVQGQGPSLFGRNWLQEVKLKGTIRRYGSRAIAHYFTASEIIAIPKIYVVLQYTCKDGCQVGG